MDRKLQGLLPIYIGLPEEANNLVKKGLLHVHKLQIARYIIMSAAWPNAISAIVMTFVQSRAEDHKYADSM